jgi:hypothetical protein
MAELLCWSRPQTHNENVFRTIIRPAFAMHLEVAGQGFSVLRRSGGRNLDTQSSPLFALKAVRSFAGCRPAAALPRQQEHRFFPTDARGFFVAISGLLQDRRLPWSSRTPKMLHSLAEFIAES